MSEQTEQPAAKRTRWDVIVSAAAWAFAVAMTFSAYANYRDLRDGRSVSAPQVTQIAMEFVVEVAPWVVVALAVTAISVVLSAGRRA